MIDFGPGRISAWLLRDLEPIRKFLELNEFRCDSLSDA